MHNQKVTVLVTGAKGQLGQCIEKLSFHYSLEMDFVLLSSSELDITSSSSIEEALDEYVPHWVVNAAAYTAVDKAEEEEERAFEINAYGVEKLAEACGERKIKLIHVSTDYVFDGDTEISYEEDNFTAPQSVYGKSKLEGEQRALEALDQILILRTSWLYSEFGKNFVKTMLHLFDTKDSLNIVSDQYGQPTNCNDLARAILQIIESDPGEYGVFHYSNYPETTWYEFASKIKEYSQRLVELHPITTDKYPTPAKRPKRSTMALDKIEEKLGIEPRHWEESLKETVELLIAKND